MEVNATEDKDKLLISDPLAYLLEAGFSLEDIERERDHAGISIADQAEAVRRIKERGEDPLEGRPEPPEEPPGTRVRSWGFFVFLKWEFSQEEPMANSSIFVFPNNTAFCRFSICQTDAS